MYLDKMKLTQQSKRLDAIARRDYNAGRTDAATAARAAAHVLEALFEASVEDNVVNNNVVQRVLLTDEFQAMIGSETWDLSEDEEAELWDIIEKLKRKEHDG